MLHLLVLGAALLAFLPFVADAANHAQSAQRQPTAGLITDWAALLQSPTLVVRGQVAATQSRWDAGRTRFKSQNMVAVRYALLGERRPCCWCRPWAAWWGTKGSACSKLDCSAIELVFVDNGPAYASGRSIRPGVARVFDIASNRRIVEADIWVNPDAHACPNPDAVADSNAAAGESYLRTMRRRHVDRYDGGRRRHFTHGAR